ncbi:MAG: hypothetical protein ABSC54_09290 [Smithellaceae bacterium]|jgi:hypothetical protein
MNRIYFLFILIISLTTIGCIPAAIVAVVGWQHLTIQDEKQIQTDKSECEGKAIKIIEARKSEIQEKAETALKISAVDQIFQQEFARCMKSKDYYKVASSNSLVKDN